MEYNSKLIRELEKKQQAYWQKNKTYASKNDSSKPPFYVLSMFPYPSGAGLHVGHPLGYIAADIFARYKRHNGFNVLHPMGFDSFGLPAEQYAIETGRHPAKTTAENIAVYKEQLGRLGFSFDPDREIRTSDPSYYKWTQWIFLLIFNSWFDKSIKKARPIDELISTFEKEGNINVKASTSSQVQKFSAEQWKEKTENEKLAALLPYRLAYLSDAEVNWCPQLGTVLANDEVKDGFSERGGYPVEKRKMKQWSMQITAYADRLLEGLERIDWPEPLKEVQRNWIGKSKGASIAFEIEDHRQKIEVFSTRPDTIYGASFMVLAPEHELVQQITTDSQKQEVEEYINQSKKKSERQRMAEVNEVTGAFTGAYCKHPLNGEKIPVWIADYVLAGYGTGAVMAVPAGDDRDLKFARTFNLPVPQIFEGVEIEENACTDKDIPLAHSDFLTGLKGKKAVSAAIKKLQEINSGKGKTNFKLRNAVFGRQRYWGEPIPVYYENGIPKPVKKEHLPLVLPEVDKYLPTQAGDPPLRRAEKWHYHPGKGVVHEDEGFPLEATTMPGWAGSSWYFLRYQDPENQNEFVSKEAVDYWQNINFYMGGSEHATGHLLYFRFWTKVLCDLGRIPFDEPAEKLVNQGMIQGESKFVYRIKNSNKFVSFGLRKEYETQKLHVDVSLVKNNTLDIDGFKNWRPDYADAEFVLENDKYVCGTEVEKMSKSKYNVINPNDICDEYGADALRLHEMFLGPVEMHKPWNTQGIDGVSKFLKKFWRLFFTNEVFQLSDEAPNKEELKILHNCIKNVTEDIEKLSLNTCVSHLMICVNELSKLKCNKREVLEPLIVLTSCHAPHISEELWQLAGKENSVHDAPWPQFNSEYLIEDTVEYPVSFNGKMRFKITMPKAAAKDAVEKAVFDDDRCSKYLAGKTPKKVIVVPGRIVNVVV